MGWGGTRSRCFNIGYRDPKLLEVNFLWFCLCTHSVLRVCYNITNYTQLLYLELAYYNVCDAEKLYPMLYCHSVFVSVFRDICVKLLFHG